MQEEAGFLRRARHELAVEQGVDQRRQEARRGRDGEDARPRHGSDRAAAWPLRRPRPPRASPRALRCPRARAHEAARSLRAVEQPRENPRRCASNRRGASAATPHRQGARVPCSARFLSFPCASVPPLAAATIADAPRRPAPEEAARHCARHRRRGRGAFDSIRGLPAKGCRNSSAETAPAQAFVAQAFVKP